MTNVAVHGVGHLSMPNHRPLAYEIADLLAEGRQAPGHDGRESVTDAAEDPDPT